MLYLFSRGRYELSPPIEQVSEQMYIPRIGTYFLKVHIVGILMRPQVWRYVHLETGFYLGWAAKAAFGALVQYPSVTVFDVPMACYVFCIRRSTQVLYGRYVLW